MAGPQATTRLRVRYSETDPMGTFYNSRALEWFECARNELLRSIGIPYAQMESRGVRLPLTESHVQYVGRAQYDDELELTASARMAGRASVRFEVTIRQANGGGAVAVGWTLHAVTDPAGKPIRPPSWLIDGLTDHGATPTP